MTQQEYKTTYVKIEKAVEIGQISPTGGMARVAMLTIDFILANISSIRGSVPLTIPTDEQAQALIDGIK